MFTRSLSDLGIEDRPIAGGKGASLGELISAGIRVPPGYVVTTAAFEAFLDENDRDGGIRKAVAALNPGDLDAIAGKSDTIRRQISDAAVPDAVRAEIVRAWRDLAVDGEPATVAIRSSATSEDSEEASFAGLQDTFLWIRGEDELVNLVKTCWASLYSTESISYRLRLGIDEAQLAMGVVVQTMVDSLCSGIMFTRSPTTGDRSVITLEGSWGLGSSVVSGDVTPDKFVINKVTREIVDRAVSLKGVMHTPNRESGGVDEVDVPADRRTVSCLSDEDIDALAGIARKVERHYGCPQDIEWAISGAGDIYLLQSRPETVWASREIEPVAKPAARAFDHVFTALGGKK